MADDIHEYFAEHIEITIGSGGWVRIFAGTLTIEAVAFERQGSHNRLAWVGTDHEGGGMLLDIGAIFAVEDIDLAALT